MRNNISKDAGTKENKPSQISRFKGRTRGEAQRWQGRGRAQVEEAGGDRGRTQGRRRDLGDREEQAEEEGDRFEGHCL